MVIGSDTTSQHPLIARRVIAAKENGTKLIVIDPRKIQLERFSDLYLPIKPGTNVALLNGMMKVILDEGLEDKKFIEERTEGFSDFLEILKDYPLDRVADITGVSQEKIREAALMYAHASNGAILYAMGVTQHTTGTDNVLSVANLALLTGNLGKPGTGVNPLRGQNNVQGACDMGCLPNVFPGYQPVSDQEKREKIASIWGSSGLSSQPGMTLTEMTEAALEGKLKSMYIVGENPILADPDLTHTEKALKNLEFLVVQDIFMTETARLAQVVLPATSFAEKEGTLTNTERRVQMIRKAINPPGEARPDSEIICRIAGLMGKADSFSFSSVEEIFEEIRKVTPQYGGMSYQRINTPEALHWPCPDSEHPGTPILHTKKFTRGLGKFHPVSFKEPPEMPDEEFSYILTTNRLMFQWHTGSMTRRSPDLESEAPEALVEINDQDADELGINNRDWVEVSSRRGKIKIKADVTDRIRRGIVSIPFHYAEAAANILTNPSFDPVAKIPGYKVCAVKITR